MMKRLIIIAIMLFCISSFAQKSKIIECKLWQPNSFCDYPVSLNLPPVLILKNTREVGITCQSLDEEKYLVGVRVTFSAINTKLFFKSGLKNISLIREQNKDTIHPVAILKEDFDFEGNKKYYYISSELETEFYLNKLKKKKQYDLIVIFKEAKKNDILIIEDYLQTIISE